MPGKCHFQDIWLEEDQWKVWLRRGKNKFNAFCTFCKKDIDVSHSGVNAIKIHQKGKKHISFEENLKSGKQLTLFSFQSSPKSSLVESRPSASTSVESITVCHDVTTAKPELSNSTLLSEQRLSSNLNSFVLSDSVTKAEILWTAHCVSTNTSTRTGGNAVDIFQVMFPDSPTASKLRLQKDKISYSVTYGLGPHFTNLMLADARNSPFYSLSVDESLNDISQKQQMDVMIKFWDIKKNCVNTRYLTSAFLEKTSAIDIMNKVLSVLKDSDLSLGKLIQLSTDGPNVNLKLINDLNEHMKETLNDGRKMLDVGTCSLHIVNGVYKTAQTKVGWKLNTLLRSLYRLFKNYPSRRAVYCQLTGSRVFPKKFCAVRWTENSDVIRRCIEMLPYLRTYFKNIANPPETDNFSTVKGFVIEDKTLEAKLYFSMMVAEELEEFLTCFQRNDPLLPFMHQQLFNLMKNIGVKFIKKKVMDSVTSSTKLKRINLESEEDLKSFETVDIGFGARSSLKNLKELDEKKFKAECKRFFIIMFKKLMEKSPLNKRVVLGASCLNPGIMSNDVLRASRVTVAIEELVSHSQVTPAEGDVIMREYIKFCESPKVKGKLNSFNWKKDKLDLFFITLFDSVGEEEVHRHLKSFIYRFLVCFHGNAAVERSFSFNKNFLVENLQEASLISQRALHDHIITLPGGLSSLIVTKKMMHDYRNSSARRVEDLKRKKEVEEDESKARKRAARELKELNMVKQKLIEEKNEMLQDIDAKINKLKQKQ